MLKNITAIFPFLLFHLHAVSQHTLDDYIELANKNSYSSLIITSEKKLADLNFISFKLNNKPSLSLYGNVPVYNKDNYAVTQPDGTIKFLPRSQNYSNIGFGFSQPIAATGGTIGINTDLYRFDDFTNKTKQYNGTPVFLRLTQPLFKYNSYRWQRQIAPLQLEEADKTMKTSMAQLAYEVCSRYFAIIESQVNLQLASANLEYVATNLAIEKRRVQLGVSTEDKVLQLEIQQINTMQQKMTAQTAMQKSLLALQTLINNDDTTYRQLELPEYLPNLEPDKEKIAKQAKNNLPQYIAWQRRTIEAKSKTEEAKKQGRQIDLVASYGLNNTATDLPAIYRNPQDQQRFSLGFSIPLTDWGRRKNSLAVARLNEEQTVIVNKQEEAKLIEEISNLINDLFLFRNNISQSLELDSLSQKRFLITNRLFQSGKASLLELQAAQSEKDNAKRNYVSALRKFWENYYLLQAKTGITF